MRITAHSITYTAMVLAFFVLAGSLCGCADAPTQQFPVVVTVAPAPIVSECNPSGRSRFPAVAKVEGNKTPASNLSDAYIGGKAADTTNRIRETRCWCAQVDERGTDAEKADAKKMCGGLKPKAPAKKSLLTKLTTFVGS